MLKKIALLLLTTVLFLSACQVVPEETEEDTPNEPTSGERFVSTFHISEDYYTLLFPYEVSGARGLASGFMTGRLDINHFEMGMVRLAQSEFSTDDYIFQEGQNLSRSTITSWNGRQTETNPNGLNPALENIAAAQDEGEVMALRREAPAYLAHIVEHNYLVKDGEGSETLGGIVIGLAMNSTNNFNLPDDMGGFPREITISEENSREQGREMANEILSRLRAMEGLEDVPITFLIYRQEARNAIVSGTFLERADVGSGNTVGNWSRLNEQNYVFPSVEAEQSVPNDVSMFNTFQTRVRQFYPNVMGIAGSGAYLDGQLHTVNIDIPMIFRSETELVGFTQYIANLIPQYFPTYLEVNVKIYSPTRQESLVVRQSGASEPFVHIYQ